MKRDQPFKALCPREHKPFAPVGQRLHPVQHAYGDPASAYGTYAGGGLCFSRLQAYLAVPVPVAVVFPFLGEKLEGAVKFPGIEVLERPRQMGIGKDGIKEVGFPREIGRGMRVGVGDQRKPFQRGKAPIHGRVRGQPGLQRMDMARQILKAFGDIVKPRISAEQGKMGRPDMGGDKYGLRAHVQGDLQQVPTVQPQNGPAVRVQVADGLQPAGQHFGVLQTGQKDQVVDLADLSVLFIYGTDLG